MAFKIPEGSERVFQRVKRDYLSLARQGVVTDVFSVTDLLAWFGNFLGEEQKYLAARMMASAVIRSNRMIESSMCQIIDILVPGELRDSGLLNVTCLSTFEAELSSQHSRLPVRFMAVDGERLDLADGNSGESLLRKLGTKFRIAAKYRRRADVASSFRVRAPTLLVLIDDVLGTGTQIKKFLREYSPHTQNNLTVVYIPMIATAGGVRTVLEAYPQIKVSPVELLQDSASFFAEDPDCGKWLQDQSNDLADVEAIYREICTSGQLSPESDFSKFLTLLMPDRYPNSTLGVFWKDSRQWHPLKRR